MACFGWCQSHLEGIKDYLNKPFTINNQNHNFIAEKQDVIQAVKWTWQQADRELQHFVQIFIYFYLFLKEGKTGCLYLILNIHSPAQFEWFGETISTAKIQFNLVRLNNGQLHHRCRHRLVTLLINVFNMTPSYVANHMGGNSFTPVTSTTGPQL